MTSCRKGETVIPSEKEKVDDGEVTEAKGFYLLNEGNMGSNKASLDYYDFATGVYTKNIFAERNPSVTKELGDVGNDLKVYGKRLYAVINCSNLIEVMTADSARDIGMVNIENCRYIAFYGGKAYVTSYAGPVQLGTNQLGYVAEIDTATLQVTRKCTVGRQPDELAILPGEFTHDGKPKIYVANSGGYTPANYDSTVSVIDIESFTEEKKINIAVNLHRIRADKHGDLYITSRGDYYNVPSNLYCYDPKAEVIKKTFDIPASNLCIAGDSIYLYSWEYSYTSGGEVVKYAMVNAATEELITDKIISDGTDALIKVPYGISVYPHTREFIVTDAGDYVSPGTLYYFNADGTLKWKTETGDIPAHVAYVY